MATKIKRQLKFKADSQVASGSIPQFNPRWPWRDEGEKLEENKDKPHPTNQSSNYKASNSNPRQITIKCFKCFKIRHITFQCPNQRTMIIGDNGEMASDHESMPPLKDYENITPLVQGDVFVIQQALNK